MKTLLEKEKKLLSSELRLLQITTEDKNFIASKLGCTVRTINYYLSGEIFDYKTGKAILDEANKAIEKRATAVAALESSVSERAHIRELDTDELIAFIENGVGDVHYAKQVLKSMW